jgi:UPF0716 protein FxsA
MSSPGAPRRATSRRARLVGAALLALPILELVGLISAGRAIGVLPTLGLLLAGAVAGVVVLRRVGARATRRFATTGPGPFGSPGRGPLGGIPVGPTGMPEGPGGPGGPAATALLVPAGLLLLVPGFLSDVAGLVLLVPAVRRAVAARMGDAVLRRLDRRTVRVVPGQVVDAPVNAPVDVRVTEIRADGTPPWPPYPPRDALPRPE